MSFRKVIIVSLFVLICKVGHSQDPPTGDPPTDPTASVPLDGGVLGLAAVGISYGIKSYRDKKKAIKK